MLIRRIAPTLLLMAFMVNTPPAAAQTGPSSVVILLDTSSSMDEWTPDRAQTKLAAAQAAVVGLVEGIDPATNVGLRTYGGGCGDPGVMRVPVSPVNRSRLRQEALGTYAGGSTPTPLALRAAAADLASFGGARTIVLVSDGQSTCGDPCRDIQSVIAQGVAVTVNTIGFAVAGTGAEPELQCIAAVSGGTYASANNAAQLDVAIRVAATRGNGGFGDLGLHVPISQPVCDGSYITVVYSAVTPGKYEQTIAQQLRRHPGSRYLLTSNTCPSLTPYKNGNLIYAVYYGPFGTLRAACAARTKGAYPRVLATNWPWQSYHKC